MSAVSGDMHRRGPNGQLPQLASIQDFVANAIWVNRMRKGCPEGLLAVQERSCISYLA